MKCLLVDDHPLILSALRALVVGLQPDVQILESENALGVRVLLDRYPTCELVVLDLQLGVDNGFDALSWIVERHPGVPVLALSDTENPVDVIRAIDAGAMGFVPKRAPIAVLTQALQLVLAGGVYVPPLQSNGALHQAPPTPPPAPVMPRFSDSNFENGFESDWETELALTPRQNEVLAGLLQGKANKLIARELGLSVDTIKDHVAAVLKALGVSTRTQAVVAVTQLAQRAGAARRAQSG